MNQWIASHLWVVYCFLFLLGGIVAYNIVTLKETERSDMSVTVKPLEPTIIRDTITIVIIWWTTPNNACRCEIVNNRRYEKKQGAQNISTEKSSPASSIEASLTKSQVEREQKKTTADTASRDHSQKIVP